MNVLLFQFSYLYFIAFGGILSGLIIYNIKPTPIAKKSTKTNGKSKNQAKKTKADTNSGRENENFNHSANNHKTWTVNMYGATAQINQSNINNAIAVHIPGSNSRDPLLNEIDDNRTTFGSFDYTRI